MRRAGFAFRTLRPFARPFRCRLVEGLAAAVVVVACRLALPWPLRGVMEIAFGHRAEDRREATVAALVPAAGDPMLWLAGSFVGLVLLQGLAEHAQRLAFARFAHGVARAARSAALTRVGALGGEGGTERRPGDVIARVVGDSARLSSGMKNALIGSTRNGLFFIGVFVILVLVDAEIAFVFLAGGGLTLGVAAIATKRAAKAARRSRRKEGRLIETVQLSLVEGGGARTSSAEGGLSDRTLTRLEGRTAIVVHAVFALTTCTILVLALQAARSGRLTAGAVFTILAYVLLMHNRTVRMARLTVRLGAVLASAERLAKLVEDKRPADSSTPRSAVAVRVAQYL